MVAALGLWQVFATTVVPAALELAYRGEGLALLRRAMSGHGSIPFAEYLTDWQLIRQRVLVLGGSLLVFGTLWLQTGTTLRRHWFAPAPLRDLGLVRIAVVGMQLALLLWPETPNASPGSSLAYQRFLSHADPALYRPPYSLELLLAPFGWGVRPSLTLLTGLWWIAVVSGTASLLGLCGRLSTLLLAWASTVLTTHAYAYGEFHHTDALQMVALWALALSPSSAALSLDSLLARRRTDAAPRDALSPFARWPLRLIQWMFAVTYSGAAMAKLLNGGFAWFQGTTLAYYFAMDATTRGLPLGVWLSEHAFWLGPLAVLCVLFELAFPLAVLVPRTAPFFAASGVALHLSIYVVHGPPFLQHIALFAAFIEPMRESARRWSARRRHAPALQVVYDGRCGLCLRSKAVLERLDITHQLAFLDLESDWDRVTSAAPGLTQESARSAMHAVDAAGHVDVGFFAFRRIARALPLLWPVRPLLWLPGAGLLGPWIYSQVAQRRSRQVCDTHSCSIDTVRRFPTDD